MGIPGFAEIQCHI